MQNVYIRSIYSPCDELGGDFLDITVDQSQNKAAVILADCTGHGLNAAMDSVMLKALSDRYKETLFSENAPDMFLKRINKDICDYNFEGRFPTMTVLIIDSENLSLTYANANGVLPFIKHNNNQHQLPPVEGFHLGYDTSDNFNKATTPIEPGDIIFLCSDAITEVMLNDEKQLGKSGVSKLISQFDSELNQDLHTFLTNVKQKAGISKFTDDVTIAALKILEDFERNGKIKKEHEYKHLSDTLRTHLAYYGYNDEIIEATLLSVRELYLNAVEHGNKNNPEKSVLYHYTINCNETCIRITDEGERFTPETIPEPANTLTDLWNMENTDKLIRGRGIFMVHYYMDAVNYNTKGNSVTISKKRNQIGTEFL
jgi:sigma-B regulation protein RsbU (phosphoserine phosphatase)